MGRFLDDVFLSVSGIEFSCLYGPKINIVVVEFRVCLDPAEGHEIEDEIFHARISMEYTEAHEFIGRQSQLATLRKFLQILLVLILDKLLEITYEPIIVG